MELQVDDAPEGPRRTILLVDARTEWIRRPNDLLGALLALLGIFAVLLVSVYAVSTTYAVTQDVRTVSNDFVRTILFMPINIVEGVLTFFGPLAILAELIISRRWRSALTAVVAGLVSGVTAVIIVELLEKYLPDSPITSTIVISVYDQQTIMVLPYFAVIAAMLAAAGSRASLVSVKWIWPLLWLVLVLSVVQGYQTLPGALATVFYGIMIGELMRWIIGVLPERATGVQLIRLIRRAGIDVTEVVRSERAIDLHSLDAHRITTSAPLGYTDRFGISQLRAFLERTFAGRGDDADDGDHPAVTGDSPSSLLEIVDGDSATDTEVPEPLVEPIAIYEDYQDYTIPFSSTVSRNYIAVDIDGVAHHVSVLDGDRHLLGQISALWNRLRLRINYREADTSIHQTAHTVTLMTLSAQHAGLVGPDLEGVASSDDSVVIATKLLRAHTLDEIHEDELTDDVLDQLWMLLRYAHSKGLAHRNIHAGCLMLDDGELIITNWHDGKIAASEVSRRIDMAQALAMWTSLVGTERAVASIERCLPPELLVSTAPVLQKSILPSPTQNKLEKKVIQKLREQLAQRVPAAKDVQPLEMHRFSIKTVVTVSIAVVAIWVLLGSMNWADVWEALKQANPFYMVIAFILGLLTYVGAALTLKAYTPETLKLREATLVQVAASIITLVVPAGIGPAALNLRYLNRQGVATALGLATVSLVQIAQLVTTIVLLVVLALSTGELSQLTLPSGSTVIVIGVVILAIASLFLIPQLRRWIRQKIGPTIDQIWPRILWLTTHPERIVFGVGGSIVQSAGFVAAFGFSLASFGYTLPVTTLAVTFLVSNTLGSVVPSPGGIGPVEAALTGGLVVAGVPYSVALSTAILYRLFTFWGRVPLGWVALRMLQRKDLV